MSLRVAAGRVTWGLGKVHVIELIGWPSAVHAGS